jgi:hypothetical protein
MSTNSYTHSSHDVNTTIVCEIMWDKKSVKNNIHRNTMLHPISSKTIDIGVVFI